MLRNATVCGCMESWWEMC